MAKSKQANNTPMFALLALFVSLIPAFIYWRIYDMPLETYALVYAGVTVLSTVALTKGYLSRSKPLVNTYSSEAKKLGPLARPYAAQKAFAWAAFFNNVVFVVAFYFLSSYALRNVQQPVQYTASVSIAAIAAWQLSGGK